MTIGQIVFLCGVALFLLSILTAVIFKFKKLEYIPENAVYAEAIKIQTQQVKKEYSTDKLTTSYIQKNDIEKTELMPDYNKTELMEKETAHIEATEKISSDMKNINS